MDLYTFGTQESADAIVAAVYASADDHYEMSFNRADFAALVTLLRNAYNGYVDIADSDFAGNLYGSIAETLGVQMV